LGGGGGFFFEREIPHQAPPTKFALKGPPAVPTPPLPAPPPLRRIPRQKTLPKKKIPGQAPLGPGKEPKVVFHKMTWISPGPLGPRGGVAKKNLGPPQKNFPPFRGFFFYLSPEKIKTPACGGKKRVLGNPPLPLLGFWGPLSPHPPPPPPPPPRAVFCPRSSPLFFLISIFFCFFFFWEIYLPPPISTSFPCPRKFPKGPKWWKKKKNPPPFEKLFFFLLGISFFFPPPPPPLPRFFPLSFFGVNLPKPWGPKTPTKWGVFPKKFPPHPSPPGFLGAQLKFKKAPVFWCFRARPCGFWPPGGFFGPTH